MDNIKRGDVIYVDLTPPHGKEMTKARPCVVLSVDVFNQSSPLLVICPITDAYGKNSPIHVFIPKGIAGCKKDSVVHCGQIRVIDSEERVIKKLSTMPIEYMKNIEDGLRILLGL